MKFHPAYLLAGQPSELERLQVQSRVWEPAAQRWLAAHAAPAGVRALDVGCGAMGWLRALSHWAGPRGHVLGTDIDPRMLEAAGALLLAETLANVSLKADDLFDSQLPAAGFDLVHARFQLAPLGRAREQVAAFRRLLRPGGWLVLEEPDLASWRLNPPAPATQALISLIARGFEAGGGDFNAGRELPDLLRQVGLAPSLRAEVVALEPGHPYLRLPLQFATSLRPRLLELVGRKELDRLQASAEREVSAPDRWGCSFTLIQAWGRSPAGR